MKTLYDLLKNWKFLLYFAVMIVLIVWNLLYGSTLLGLIFLALILIAVAINLYKTRAKPSPSA